MADYFDRRLSNVGFWDSSTPDVHSYFPDEGKGLFVVHGGKRVYVVDILERLERVESALADFLILGPGTDGPK